MREFGKSPDSSITNPFFEKKVLVNPKKQKAFGKILGMVENW
jgi:hypothetical protein